MNESGRKVIDNVCNIFTLLSIVMLIFAGFIMINEHRLDNLIVVEKMKITSMEKREDKIGDEYLPAYVIEVQQNINGHDYTSYISRIPTGYTDRTRNDDKTADYKVGDMAEVYIDSSSMTDYDFDIIYNLSLFRSGEIGYVSAVPLTVALVCFLIGVARITKMANFYKKHKVFVITPIVFVVVTGVIYLLWEISIRQSTGMFKGLGEGLLLNGALIVGMLTYVIASICITVSDYRKSKTANLKDVK